MDQLNKTDNLLPSDLKIEESEITNIRKFILDTRL